MRGENCERWHPPASLRTKVNPPPCFEVLTRMAKPGRNDPCPCGSGKKYKKCCLPNDERMKLADEHTASEERATARKFNVQYLKEALADRLAQQWYAHGDDEIAVASHVVVELVQAGNLEDAETAARDLITRY